MTPHVVDFISYTMPNIFLDNQTYIYVFEQRKPQHVKAFRKISSNPNFTLVATFDNLIEFSKSASVEQAIQLASAYKYMPTKWLDNFYNIQLNELERFFLSNFFMKPPHQKAQYLLRFSDLFDGLQVTPELFIKKASTPSQKAAFQKKHQEHAEVLDKLRQHGSLNKQQHEASNSLYLARRIYDLFTEARFPVTKFSDLPHLLEFSKNNIKKLYNECPSISAENHLADFRATNKTRKPRASDSIDYTSSITALPYVYIFITNDGFLFECLKYIKRKTGINTKILRNISDIH